MDRHEKAKRALELSEQIKTLETELDGLLGGPAVKRTWSRRPKAEQKSQPPEQKPQQPQQQ